MSNRRFRGRFVAVAIACGIMMSLAPGAAHAETIFEFECVPVPITTPGVTVAGQRIPALSNIAVCGGGGVTYEVKLPRIVNHTGCGNPCFSVRATINPIYLSEDGFSFAVRWWEDGIEKFPGPSNPIVNPVFVPDDGQAPYQQQEVCLLLVGDQNAPPCEFPL